MRKFLDNNHGLVSLLVYILSFALSGIPVTTAVLADPRASGMSEENYRISVEAEMARVIAAAKSYANSAGCETTKANAFDEMNGAIKFLVHNGYDQTTLHHALAYIKWGLTVVRNNDTLAQEQRDIDTLLMEECGSRLWVFNLFIILQTILLATNPDMAKDMAKDTLIGILQKLIKKIANGEKIDDLIGMEDVLMNFLGAVAGGILEGKSTTVSGSVTPGGSFGGKPASQVIVGLSQSSPKAAAAIKALALLFQAYAAGKGGEDIIKDYQDAVDGAEEGDVDKADLNALLAVIKAVLLALAGIKLVQGGKVCVKSIDAAMPTAGGSGSGGGSSGTGTQTGSGPTTGTSSSGPGAGVGSAGPNAQNGSGATGGWQGGETSGGNKGPALPPSHY